MKRYIAAVALAFLAFPGSTLAMQDVRGGSLGVAAHLAQPQAKGTDVAAPDQQASTRSTSPAIELVADDDSGFDWGDAGIGAATAASLLGISLAGGMTLRRRHRRGPALPA
jgi:hypothetical protein